MSRLTTANPSCGGLAACAPQNGSSRIICSRFTSHSSRITDYYYSLLARDWAAETGWGEAKEEAAQVSGAAAGWVAAGAFRNLFAV
jgi:hypothetical protein